MNLQQFTIKAQDTLAKAQQLALANGNQGIEPLHVLQAMLKEDLESIQYIAGKVGANLSRVEQAVEQSVKALPKVSGGGDPYITSATNQALVSAEKTMHEMKDEFITNEHLLVGLLDGKDAAATLLKDAGFKKADIIKAIQALRGGQKVQSQTAENQFNALKKYALNLNQLCWT